MFLDDTNNKTHFNINLSTVLYIINTWNEFNRIAVFYHIHRNITVKVTYNIISASKPHPCGLIMVGAAVEGIKCVVVVWKNGSC